MTPISRRGFLYAATGGLASEVYARKQEPINIPGTIIDIGYDRATRIILPGIIEIPCPATHLLIAYEGDIYHASTRDRKLRQEWEALFPGGKIELFGMVEHCPGRHRQDLDGLLRQHDLLAKQIMHLVPVKR